MHNRDQWVREGQEIVQEYLAKYQQLYGGTIYIPKPSTSISSESVIDLCDEGSPS